MECFLSLLALAILGAGIWLLVAVVVAYRRSGANRKRIEGLERELAALRRELAARPVGEAAPARAPEPERLPAVAEAPPERVAPAPSTATATASLEVGLPGPAAPGAEAPAAEAPEVEIPTVEAPAVESPGAPIPGAEPPQPQPPLPAISTAAPPASRPAPASEAPPAPPPPPSRIDWEQWIGVKGAAVLGAVALILAGFYFLKIAIEQGWIPPAVRVAAAVLAGVGALVASEALRRRAFTATANALAGAGVVLLYAAFWAAWSLYGLLGAGTTFALMALVTVTAGLLSWRHRSQVVALLGLLGGFATPLLLATGDDRPVTLFSYLFLLNGALLALGRRRRWPWLGLAGLAGTALYQLRWIAGRMRPEEALLGLAVLALFALLFALSAPGVAGRLQRAAGILVPFLFALYFAARAELGPHLYPLAALLLLLSLAALWAGREPEAGGLPWLATATAAASVGVVAVWGLDRELAGSLAWEAVICALGLALAFHLAAEWRAARAARERTTKEGGEPAQGPSSAVVAGVGFFALLILFPLGIGVPAPWPWLAGWIVLAGMLVRQAGLGVASGPRPRLQAVAAAGLGLGLTLFFLVHRESPPDPSPALLLGLGVAAGILFQVLALARRQGPLRRAAEQGAALLPLVLLTGLLGRLQISLRLLLPVSLALALLSLLAATRLGSGGWYAAATALLALVQTAWTAAFFHLFSGAADPGVALPALTVQGLAVLLLTAWPLLAGRSFTGGRLAWYAAALAGPAWFPSLRELWELRFGDGAIGLLPVLLGCLSLAADFSARRKWPPEEPRRRSALVWFAAVALGFVSAAIPLQLEKSWITVGWALEAAALAALWRRLEHPGLKYLSLALGTAVTMRLLANPAVLGYYPPSPRPVFNWLMYTYLVPAAALFATAALLAPLEVPRLKPWEEGLYARRKALGAGACSLAGILVVFAWINLTILDAFADGRLTEISLARMPARDLTLSLAWAVYALVLLGVGMARDSGALRWLSLAFLLLTIGKVFLYDLGELRDLYRVASLVGLAASLILVSLAYQRFVFQRGREEGGSGEDGG